MDKETLEAFKSIVKEAIKEETKEIEAAMKSQLEDVTGVIRDVAVSLGARMDRVEEEVQETKTAVLRIEQTLQDKQEAQGDLIQDTRQRVERIEDHLHLPHSLSVAA